MVCIRSMQKPTIWIVGGVDKGNDYSSLKGLVKQKVLGIICLGKENHKIQEEFGEIISPIYEAQSASQAVQISYRIAKKGYAVLLSPACASFDLFKDYEDRGHQFKKRSDHFKFNDMNKVKEKTTSLLVQHRQQSLASFSSIEHRLEVVREMNDVLWINDSKSTDMGAACFSLENLHEDIIWIVGYDENKRNLDIVTDVAMDKVDQIICYGHFETEINTTLHPK